MFYQDHVCKRYNSSTFITGWSIGFSAEMVWTTNEDGLDECWDELRTHL